MGHYILPLLNFGGPSEASFNANQGNGDPQVCSPNAEVEGSNFGPEGSAEDLTRHGFLPEPSLEGHSPALEEAKCGELTSGIPDFNQLQARTQAQASASMIRLARDTHGPWIQLPKEMPAVYLILGKSAYDATSLKPGGDATSLNLWQVRAAQIGYRARVIRKPPMQMAKDSWTLVLGLEGKSVRVLVDWTQSDICSGRPIPETTARMFMFVFALRSDKHGQSPMPNMNITARVPHSPRDLRTVFYMHKGGSHEFFHSAAKHYQLPPKSSGLRLAGVKERYTYCTHSGELLDHFIFHSSIVEKQETVQSTSLAAVAQALVAAAPPVSVACLSGVDIEGDAFESCEEGVEDGPFPSEVCASECSGNRCPPGLCSCSRAHDREVREQDVGHIPLCILPTMPHLQGEADSSQHSDREDHVFWASRLQGDLSSRAFYVQSRTVRAGHRRPRSHLQRKVPGWDRSAHPVPTQHPQGHESTFATFSGPGTQRFRIDTPPDSDAQHTEPCHNLRDSEHGNHRGEPYDHCCTNIGADTDTFDAATSASPGSLGANHVQTHGLRQGDDSQGARRSHQCRAGRCTHACSDLNRCCQGDSGARRESLNITGTSGLPPTAAGAHNIASANVDTGIHHDFDTASGNNSRHQDGVHRDGRLRSRHRRWLGACCAVLINGAFHAGVHVPVAEDLKPSAEGVVEQPPASDWPILSQEVGVMLPPDKDDLTLPQAWRAQHVPSDSRRATRQEVRRWLGPQGWLMNRDVEVGLVEVFAGEAMLSQVFEECGSHAIRLGQRWGQDLSDPSAKWLLESLVHLKRPRDVFVSHPGRVRLRHPPENRQVFLQEQLRSRTELDLFFSLAELQSSSGRGIHCENPVGSLAWRDKRYARFTRPHGYVEFSQCCLGLIHPETQKPLRKPTRLFTTCKGLAKHMAQYQCGCKSGSHDRIAGYFQGRSLSAWCERHPEQLCRALIAGFRGPKFLPGSGGTALLGSGPAEIQCELPTVSFDDRCEHVQKCWYTTDGNIQHAYPSEPTNTVFKITDPDIAKQLNQLQFPGRYRRDDLPIPIRAQLRSWSGLEVDTVVTSKRLKCFVNAPTGVVATMRTTVVRTGSEWFYVDYAKSLEGTAKIRLPLNASLIVTCFGDKPTDMAPPAEAQPVVRPLPGEVESSSTQAQVHQYLQRLHIGLGHCGRAELLQHLNDAGAASWLLKQAQNFVCSVCDAQKPPASHSIVGSAKPRSFNSIVTIDTLDLTLERDSVQHRVFLLTVIDTATSYAKAYRLESGDAPTAVKALEIWFDAYGPPEHVYCDPDTIFRSEHFGQFLTRNAVLQRLSAAQAPFQHGQIERLHRTL